MWKTRFEVSTSHSNGLTRYRSSSSSKIVHHYYSRPLPTVPRVRDDSPSAINRPSPPTSISNLDILIEEDEDILPTNLINNEQTNLLLSKQNSSQILNNNNKYQIVLPTILELNDHEHNQSIDEKYNIQLKQKKQDSFIPTNTNNNHILNCDNQRKEEKLNTKNKQIIEFTLNKRINQFLQKRIPRQNKVRDIMFVFAT